MPTPKAVSQIREETRKGMNNERDRKLFQVETSKGKLYLINIINIHNRAPQIKATRRAVIRSDYNLMWFYTVIVNKYIDQLTPIGFWYNRYLSIK